MVYTTSPIQCISFGTPCIQGVSAKENIDPSPYSLSPVSAKSQKLLRSPRKATRKISRIPFKVLDAPELQDDFYLNLVDWSAQNVLSVGLGSCVYLWSACTSQVTRLCDLSSENNAVTSVAWSERGHLVAVGTQKGHISVWDVAVNKEVTKLQGHIARVGALAWNGDILSSGSRDRHIRQRDTRTPAVQSARVLQGHRQEVCGLKWSPDGQSLASGGNDNKLFVWSMHSTSPVQTYGAHLAAVKAIAWSPHQHGLLASGGGTADRCIRFWNTLTSQPMQCVDTVQTYGAHLAAVKAIAWSPHQHGLLASGGGTADRCIRFWNTLTSQPMQCVDTVQTYGAHLAAVKAIAWSPHQHGLLASGGGTADRCIRFWNTLTSQPMQCVDTVQTYGAHLAAVKAIAWSPHQHGLLASGGGTADRCIRFWNTLTSQPMQCVDTVQTYGAHLAAVKAIAWSPHQHGLLASGGGTADRCIRFWNTLTSQPMQCVDTVQTYGAHLAAVKAIAWSPHQHGLLASGGGTADRCIRFWNTLTSQPMQCVDTVQTYGAHLAAVKAIAWSPHQHGLLASGGGTADRCIRFWNTLTSQPMQCVDTGSQVCNLAWSKHSSELVSTHGYSQNQILVWKYPSLTQVAKLTGHSYRVLYLALSPDGEAIVTGAGDETLRFWNVFSKTPSHKENKSVLNLYTALR
ncbi:protein FIZZY-RELATED 2 [Phthorimaea operculella]|nr:protein FIZZY-RELATED 2 [Phthorimaea operculella]